MDYRRSTVVVVHAVGDDWVIWQVATIVPGLVGRLSGAWRFPVSDLDTWDRLTFSRRSWATAEAAQRLAADGITLPLSLDADLTRHVVVDRFAEVAAAFTAHAASLPKSRPLVVPPWPTVPPPLDPNVEAPGAPADVARPLGVARWFAGMADAWDVIEAVRTNKSRQYLHPLGGPRPMAFPLPQPDSIV